MAFIPKLKKDVSDFLSHESGTVSKQALMTMGVLAAGGSVAVASGSQYVEAGHSSVLIDYKVTDYIQLGEFNEDRDCHANDRGVDGCGWGSHCSAHANDDGHCNDASAIHQNCGQLEAGSAFSHTNDFLHENYEQFAGGQKDLTDVHQSYGGGWALVGTILVSIVFVVASFVTSGIALAGLFFSDEIGDAIAGGDSDGVPFSGTIEGLELNGTGVDFDFCIDPPV